MHKRRSGVEALCFAVMRAWVGAALLVTLFVLPGTASAEPATRKRGLGGWTTFGAELGFFGGMALMLGTIAVVGDDAATETTGTGLLVGSSAVLMVGGPVLELGADFLPAGPAGEPTSRRDDAPEAEVPPAVLSQPMPVRAARRGEVGSASLEDVQRQHILGTLERCNWVIEGPGGAAVLLGLQPSTLRSRLKKLGLARHSPHAAT